MDEDENELRRLVDDFEIIREDVTNQDGFVIVDKNEAVNFDKNIQVS